MKRLLFILIMLTFAGSSFAVIKTEAVTINVFRIFFLLFCAMHMFNKKPENVKFSNKKFYKNLMFAFMFFMAITYGLKFNASKWLNGFIFILIDIFLMYFIVMYSETLSDVDYYMKAFAIGLLVNMVVAVYEYNTQNHIISTNYLVDYMDSEWAYEALAKAPTAFLYNPNNIGVAVVLGVPFGNYLKIAKKRSTNLLIKTLWFILCTYVAFATGSRGAILLVFFSIIMTLLFERTDAARKIAGIVGIMLVVMFLLYANSDYIMRQLKYSGLLGQTSLIDSKTDASRIKLIEGGLIAAKKYLYLGTGPMSAEAAIYKEANIYGSVHNFWIEWLVNQGLGGMICFVVLYLHCLKSMLISKAPQSKAVLASLILFAFASMVPPTIMTLNFIWLIFGFGIAIEKFDCLEREKKYNSKLINIRG